MLFIALNALLRSTFPTSYVPAVQSHPSIIFHPFVIRTLATIAEYDFYKLEAEVFQFEGWFAVFCIGETVSWCHLLLQSEALGLLEDSVWVLFQMFILFTQDVDVYYWCILAYITIVANCHLHQLYQRIKPPYLSLYRGVQYKHVDSYSACWIIASVWLKAVVYIILLHLQK